MSFHVPMQDCGFGLGSILLIRLYNCWVDLNHRPLGYEPNRTRLTSCDSVGLTRDEAAKTALRHRVLEPNWSQNQSQEIQACRESCLTVFPVVSRSAVLLRGLRRWLSSRQH
jgi:hypothetical protein